MKSTFFFDIDIWEDFLDKEEHDFYHIPAYLEMESESLEGKPFAYYFEKDESRALIPLIRRRVVYDGGEYYDLLSPYGYSGILTNKKFDQNLYNDVIADFIDICKSNGIISAFIRLNPIYNDFHFNESKQIIQQKRGKTVFVDLEEPYSEIYKGYISGHKWNLKRLLKSNYHICFNKWDDYDQWQHLYDNTMNRLQASDYYLFSKLYFNTLRDIMHNQLMLVTVYDENNKLAAGGLFTTYHGVIQYHLSATTDEHINMAPTKLLIDAVIKWGQENKYKVLHLGGGVNSSSDSLFAFKYGFSKKVFQFSTLSCITNPDVYDEVVNTMLSEQSPRQTTDEINFFPLYRYKIK